MTNPNSIRLAASLLVIFWLSEPALVAQGSVTVSVEPGPGYSTTRTAFLTTITVNPHLAVWLESADGKLVKTIYVSLKKGQQDVWVGKRPHPLPIWSARAEKLPLPDAITGASTLPPLPAKLEWSSKFPANGPFTVRLEVNLAFDYNKTWPEIPQEVWGQPSLLYSTALPAAGASSAMELIGRSDAQTGRWTSDMTTIDSARKILGRIEVRSTGP